MGTGVLERFTCRFIMEFPTVYEFKSLELAYQRRNAILKISPKTQYMYFVERGHVRPIRKAYRKMILVNQIVRSRPKYKAQTRLVAVVRSALMRAVLKWRSHNKNSNTGYPANLNVLKQLVETDPEAAKDGVLTVKMTELFEFRAFIEAAS